jgi:hypothetical protein
MADVLASTINHVQSARVRRESYVGTWLPEPLLTDTESEGARHSETADSLSLAFLVLLESLGPVERAVFLLREVFDYGYDEIAAVVSKSEDNCRQIAVRGRRQIEAKRPRFEAEPGPVFGKGPLFHSATPFWGNSTPRERQARSMTRSERPRHISRNPLAGRPKATTSITSSGDLKKPRTLSS